DSEKRRSHRLMKKLNRASVVDGEMRDLLDCRRSRRFSPPVLPVSSEIDSVRAPLLSPVVETLDSEIEGVAESRFGVDLALASSPVIRASVPRDSCCPVSSPSMPVVVETVGGVGPQGGAVVDEECGPGGPLTPTVVVNSSMVNSVSSPLLADLGLMADEVGDSQVDQSSSMEGVSVEEMRVTVATVMDGQGCLCSEQGCSLAHDPVTAPAVVNAVNQDGHHFQRLRTVGQGGDFQSGDPMMAGVGLGKFHKQAGDGEPVGTHGATEGIGVRGGSGPSYASAVGTG
ncbi:hypothetical protein Dimus_022476, partial [Dionaea muscipula]